MVDHARGPVSGAPPGEPEHGPSRHGQAREPWRRDRFVGLTPREVLHRVFGFPAFRGLQEEAVDRVMAGGDTLVLMPTGGGKSVCYQVPAPCRPGRGLVVSPLIVHQGDQLPHPAP